MPPGCNLPSRPPIRPPCGTRTVDESANHRSKLHQEEGPTVRQRDSPGIQRSGTGRAASNALLLIDSHPLTHHCHAYQLKGHRHAMNSLPVPYELLAKIFLFCLPDADIPIQPNDAPLILTRVCREWREVALAMPQLWTNICLLSINPYADRIPLLPPLTLETWLANSQSLPITITIDLDTLTRVDLGYFSYVRALCTHSDRWSKIHLNMGHASQLALKFMDKCLADQRATLPILDHLYMFQGPYDLRAPYVISFLERLGASPKLQSLHFSQWHLIAASDLLPWRSIRQYRLHCTRSVNLNLNGILNRSKDCPCLTMLDLDISNIDSYVDGAINAPVSLPHLRMLRLRLPSHEDLIRVFRSIQVRHLEALVINSVRREGPEDRYANALAQCLDHCASTLRTLEIPSYVSTQSHDTDKTMFQNVRNLESLTVRDVFPQKMSIDMLRCLILLFDGSRLVRGKNLALKRLQIELYDYWPSYESNPAFVAGLTQVVTSRWYIPDGAMSDDGQSIQRLCSFHVEPDSHLDDLLQEYPVEYERIKQCWREGLSRESVSEWQFGEHITISSGVLLFYFEVRALTRTCIDTAALYE